MILRFIGIAFIALITFVISKFSGIDMINMMVLVSFILTADNLVCKFLMYQYMLALNKIKKDDEHE